MENTDDIIIKISLAHFNEIVGKTIFLINLDTQIEIPLTNYNDIKYNKKNKRARYMRDYYDLYKTEINEKRRITRLNNKYGNEFVKMMNIEF